MTIHAERALNPPPRPSTVDRGVAGVFHRGPHRRRSRRRNPVWLVRERRLGSRLDRELTGWAIALHSRLPAADLDCGPIDHLVVAPAGVWVVDADHESRRLTTAACVELIERRHRDLTRRADAVRVVLSSIGFDWLDIHPVACSTNAGGLRRRPLEVDGIWCARSTALASLISRPGPLGHPDVVAIATELSQRFPAAR